MSILELSAQDYHADRVADQPTLSASIARVLCSQTPAHAKAAHPRLNPNYERKTDEKFDIGIVCHQLLLEGMGNVHIVQADNWRSAAAQQERDDARAVGRVPLLAKHWADVQAMCAAVAEQFQFLQVDPIPFTNGKAERVIVWDEDGVKCRARLDWLSDDATLIEDLKTTAKSADPLKWGQHTLFGMHYDLQAAVYRRAVKAATGVEPDFRFIVVETSPPFACSVVSLDRDAWELADSKFDYALAVWKRCLELDRWDAYDKRVAFASPPGWAAAQWTERETFMEAA